MSTSIKAKYTWTNSVETIVTLDLSQKVSKYFSVGEVANQSSTDDIKYISTPRHRKFLKMMDMMREKFGPIAPSSCFRTESFNATLAGADPKSRHLYGEAMDWPINSISSALRQQVRDYWEYLCIRFGEVGAINLYTKGFHFEIGSDQSYGASGFKVRDYRGTKYDWT